MTASTGRWSDPAASRRAAGLAVMDGTGPAASVVTAPSATKLTRAWLTRM